MTFPFQRNAWIAVLFPEQMRWLMILNQTFGFERDPDLLSCF
jgi:hypothetical protein